MGGAFAKRIVRLAPLACLPALGKLAMVGTAATSTRYWADDYCFAAMVRTSGMLGAQADWYRTWTGRFAATFVASAAGWMPVAAADWIPALLLVAWVGGLAWAIGELLPDGADSLALAVALALGLAVAVLALAPARAQDVAWLTGAASYLLPLVLATPVVGLLLRARKGTRGRSSLLVAGLLALLAAGCSETFTGMELGGFAAAVALCFALPAMHPARWVAVAALLGAAAGAVIVAAAPGNANRIAALHTTSSLAHLIDPALLLVPADIRQLVAHAPAVLPLAALLGAAAAQLLPRVVLKQPARICLLGLLVSLVMAYGALAPGAYNNVSPPSRSLLELAVVLVAASAGAGFVLCAGLRGRVQPVGGAVLLLTMVALVATFPGQPAPLDRLDSARAAAAQWDASDRVVRAAVAAGKETVTVPRIPSGPLLDGLEVAWVRDCAQRYYGIRLSVP